MKISARFVPAVVDVLAVLSAFSLASCSPENGDPFTYPGGDAGADAAADADAGADAGGEWSCPEPPTAICPETGAYAPWAEAGDVGDGYSFVDVEGHRVLLAERPGGTGGSEPILVVGDWGSVLDLSSGEYEIVALADPPPAEPLRAIDLVAGGCPYSPDYGFLAYDSVLGYPAVTLLCGDSGCALYAMVVDDPETARLAPIPGGDAPIPEVHGLVHHTADLHEAASTDPVCAFGDGIACFDGATWTTLLEPGGPILLAATLIEEDWTTRLLAAGDSCRIVKETDGGFAEIPLDCGASLEAISAEWEFFAAGGSGVLVLGYQGEILVCPTDGIDVSLVRAVSHVDSDSHVLRKATVFGGDGEIVEVGYHELASTACAFTDPLDGPARALTSIAPGDDAYGSMVVTDSVAYYRIEGGGPPMK